MGPGGPPPSVSLTVRSPPSDQRAGRRRWRSGRSECSRFERCCACGSRHREQGVIVVALGGALDRSAFDQLWDELHHVWDAHGVSVVLDLSQVTYLDSAGMRALLLAQRELAAARRSLTIRQASPVVRRLLELTGTGYLSGLPAHRNARAL